MWYSVGIILPLIQVSSQNPFFNMRGEERRPCLQRFHGCYQISRGIRLKNEPTRANC